MLQFPVQWQKPKSSNNFVPDISVIGNCEEWTVTLDNCNLKISRTNSSVLIFVSGWISCMRTEHSTITQKFAKLMNPHSSAKFIELEYPLVPDPRSFPFGSVPTSPIYNVSGMVYILPPSENSVNSFLTDKCKHCQSLEELSNDFGRLLDPQISSFADFNVKCGDVIIPTHKNILSARSPVFAAMFSNEMKENWENIVNITDIDEGVIRSMLTFMYTGKVSLTVELASDLLPAANKYQMDILKEVCCSFLKENLTLENMLKIYALVDLHAESLKSYVEYYICKICTDFSTFETTEQWKTFRKNKPDLALDVAISMLKLRELKSKDEQREVSFLP